MMNFASTQPATIPEAIDLLERGLSERDKQYLRDEGVDGAHHALGRNIRNGWDLWFPDTALVKWSLDTYGVDHADDISGLILGGLHGRLCGKTFDFEAEAERYRRHWREMAEGPKAVPASFRLMPVDWVPPPPPSQRKGWLSRIMEALHGRR